MADETKMTDAEIERHRGFLEELGVAGDEIEAATQLVRARQSGEQFAWSYASLPLLPAEHVAGIVESEGRAMRLRPGMYGTGDKWCLYGRIEFYRLAAMIMDMRVRQGDEGAAASSEAIGAHIVFLQERVAAAKEG